MSKNVVFCYFFIIVVNYTFSQVNYKDIHDKGHWDYRTCPECKGKGTSSRYYTLVCENCKDWAESYRNIKGCDICKNNKTVKKFLTKPCIWCDGFGKQHNIYWKKENVDLRNKEYNCSQLKEKIWSYKYPTKLELANSLIGKRTENWVYESLDEFIDVKIKNEIGSVFFNCENPEECYYVVDVDLKLFDRNTRNVYYARLKIKFTPKDEKWVFDKILTGNISEY